MANSKPSDIVEKALREAIGLMDDHEDGDILIDWMVITFVDNANNDEGNAYPMLFSNGDMPTYRARGLLHTGLKFLNE